MDDLKTRGLVLLGCGKMGSAMLKGWLDGGLPPASVTVLDPHPSDWLKSTGVHLNADLPENPAIVLLAVKPQMMGDALPALQKLGNGSTVFLTVAAGITIATYEEILGAETPIVRAMPNTPAAVGRGITGIVGNAKASKVDVDLAESLLQAVGLVVRLETEAQIRPLMAISGCGPAYVFHLIEVMAAAGEKAGLPADMALQLAKATVAGAGHLAEVSDESPAQLRINVTSPGGVTAEALRVLMDEENGFPVLMERAVEAAIERDEELANG
ncbi:pyrroline-5-carboxylate reductase [Celeribacter halophilus]|uniref:Pyrroline-5-carboxylate reductase n=1 Tax=Celeribacter halophilus TaxID=576117 RepID=A0A1I3RJK6_9RHOB|nr:pyrroline-5-carboxylate reductase [Celeribacter halophilus]PZX12645.1 pyrroline-5-carboxylate reductase [Celeribacter halophilus]SFJ46814.1 pyrroline-5-carboxylate reductase [Celeribacter halophilus]